MWGDKQNIKTKGIQLNFHKVLTLATLPCRNKTWTKKKNVNN